MSEKLEVFKRFFYVGFIMKSILFPKEAFVNPKLSEYFCQILLEQSLVAKISKISDRAN